MVLADRWPDERLAEPGETGCYGKIPSEREFVRLGIDSGEALWVSDLVTSVHELLVERDLTICPGRELRIVVLDPDSETLLAVLLRASKDAVGRRYPVSVFCTLPRSDFEEEKHLTPLYLGDLWDVFGSQVLSAEHQDAEDLADAIDAAAVDLADADTARQQQVSNLDTPMDDPLAALLGDGSDRAARLVELARCVEPACQHLVLDPSWAGESHQLVGAQRTAMLWHLLDSHTGPERGFWAAIEVWDAGETTDWRKVGLYSRLITPDDVAAMLAESEADLPALPPGGDVTLPPGWVRPEGTPGSLRDLFPVSVEGEAEADRDREAAPAEEPDPDPEPDSG